MNILIFASPLRHADDGTAHALVAGLTQAGHVPTLVTGDSNPRPDVSQVDLIVHQLDTGEYSLPVVRERVAHLPGVLWLCGVDAADAARCLGPSALGMLVPAGHDASALLSWCPGPVSGAGDDACGALLAMCAAVQGLRPVRAAADEMAAVLRRWGATDTAIEICGLSAAFDLFER
jgi:hypothetical protein